MISLLERAPTPEDAEAEGDLPRPGVWAGERTPRYDFRPMTQEQTDSLIRRELSSIADPSERADIDRACGPRFEHVYLALEWAPRFKIFGQRGGIDSDPLVRVLARRAWGDRDRTWFELRGVRKGEAVAEDRPTVRPWGSELIVGCARRGDVSFGRAVQDARPGERVEVERSGVTGALGGPVVEECRVSDRLRRLPHSDLATRLARRKRQPDARVASDAAIGLDPAILRQMNLELDRAALDALDRGIPASSMWTEVATYAPEHERRLMTGPDGMDTPRPLRQVIVRVWLDCDDDAGAVRSKLCEPGELVF